MITIDRIASTWWFGHALLFSLCAGILLVAALMSPSEQMLTFFGIEIPIMCGFRRTFGIPCLGCGMTRSFVFLAHGHPIEAFQMNVIGPFLFAFLASQVPYRGYKLFTGWRNGG